MCFHKWKEIKSYITKTKYFNMFWGYEGITEVLVKIFKCSKCNKLKGNMIDNDGNKQKLDDLYIYKIKDRLN